MTRLFEAKPFLIAEIGSNFETFQHAKDSIALAAKCGADAVKFQLFSPSALYGFEGGTDAYSLPLDWLPKLKEKAKACGIEFMCTAFSPELVKAVDPFVEVHKVASSDLSYPQLLQAIKATKKPVILSTGASNEGDIRTALAEFQYWFDPDDEDYVADPKCPLIVLMYCVSAYPAKTIDLRVPELIAKQIHQNVGFSDHTTDIIWAPTYAALAGAVAIEKHFTAFPELDTPDRPHSLTPDEFKTMVDYIRGVRKPVIGPTPEERDMLLRFNRRLIATKDIAAGGPLVYGETFGAYRSLKDDTRGLSPFAWQQVEGKRATKAIARGDGIGPGDFG